MKINEIFEIDWVNFVCQKYREISKDDKTIFLIIFFVLNFMFIFNTINHLWGHDDWWAINKQTYLDNSLYNGRFCAYFLKHIFFQGQLLPVVNNVFAFLGFTLGAIYLLKYWELDNKVKYFVIAGVMFVCSPFTNAWLHFQHSIIEVLWLFLFIVCGLNLAIKYKITDKLKFFVSNIASIFLIFLSIAIYQPCINAIMVILLGKLFIKSVEGKFKELLYIFRNSFVNIAISSLLYIYVYKICVEKNIIDTGWYSQELVNNMGILNQLKPAVMAIFTELFNYEKILMPSVITKLFSIIVIIAIFTCVIKILADKTKVLKKIVVSSLIFCLMLFATQFAQIITVYNIFGVPRIVFWGMWVFHIFALVLVFKYSSTIFKNISYLVCLIIFFNFITVNFVAQKSFKFGTIAEIFRINRVTERIEQNKNFVPKKPYSLLIVGDFKPLSEKYVGKFDGSYAWEFANASIIPNYEPQHALTFYNDDLNVKESFTYNQNRLESEFLKYFDKLLKDEDVVKKLKEHLKTLKSWPSANSIVIDDDLIILVLDEESLENLKKDFAD